MTHTPGPWTIEEYGDEELPNLVIHKDSETRVCFMATPGSRGDPAEIVADARLIAAAPDMLDAFRAMAEAPYEQPIGAWRGVIHAMIRKAEIGQ